jgi:hypothetical protein
MPSEEQLNKARREHKQVKGGFIERMLQAEWQSTLKSAIDSPISINGVPIKHGPEFGHDPMTDHESSRS